MNEIHIVVVALAFAGTCSLMFLSIGFMLAGRGAGYINLLAGALSLIGAAAVAIVSLQNFSDLGGGEFMEPAEFVLTVAAGPLFFLLICEILKLRVLLRHVVAPAMMMFLVAIVGDLSGLIAVDIRAAVIVQIGYSAAALTKLIAANSRPSLSVVAIMCSVGILHTVQIARMTLPDMTVLYGAVPFVLSVSAFVVVALAARRFAYGWVKISHRDAPRTVTIERLREAMLRDDAFLQPDFKLSDLAVAAKVSATDASAVINRETEAGFKRFLNSQRVRAARRMLASPAEAETSIEAIAMLTGFRSRSAFYRAFSEEYGVSPASVRGRKTLS